MDSAACKVEQRSGNDPSTSSTRTTEVRAGRERIPGLGNPGDTLAVAGLEEEVQARACAPE